MKTTLRSCFPVCCFHVLVIQGIVLACACVNVCVCVCVKGVATHRELKAHKQTLQESAVCGGCRAE